MKAELIAVGTEILTGQITNTNAQFLSEKLAELGIDVYFHTAVGDNENRLLSVLDQASQRSDLVILCGGLGPTEDDLTKQTLAKFLGKELVFDEEMMEKCPSCARCSRADTRCRPRRRPSQWRCAASRWTRGRSCRWPCPKRQPSAHRPARRRGVPRCPARRPGR